MTWCDNNKIMHCAQSARWATTVSEKGGSINGAPCARPHAVLLIRTGVSGVAHAAAEPSVCSTARSVPGSWVCARHLFHLSLLLAASRMGLPQDPSTRRTSWRAPRGRGSTRGRGLEWQRRGREVEDRAVGCHGVVRAAREPPAQQTRMLNTRGGLVF